MPALAAAADFVEHAMRNETVEDLAQGRERGERFGPVASGVHNLHADPPALLGSAGGPSNGGHSPVAEGEKRVFRSRYHGRLGPGPAAVWARSIAKNDAPSWPHHARSAEHVAFIHRGNGKGGRRTGSHAAAFTTRRTEIAS